MIELSFKRNWNETMSIEAVAVRELAEHPEWSRAIVDPTQAIRLLEEFHLVGAEKMQRLLNLAHQIFNQGQRFLDGPPPDPETVKIMWESGGICLGGLAIFAIGAGLFLRSRRSILEDKHPVAVENKGNLPKGIQEIYKRQADPNSPMRKHIPNRLPQHPSVETPPLAQSFSNVERLHKKSGLKTPIIDVAWTDPDS